MYLNSRVEELSDTFSKAYRRRFTISDKITQKKKKDGVYLNSDDWF